MEDFKMVICPNDLEFFKTIYAQTEQVNKIKVSKERRKIQRHCISKIVSTDHLFEKLKSAICSNDIQKVEELIEEGAPILKADTKNRTPLHIAAAAGNHKIVSLLLDHGADSESKDIIGNTALHLATSSGKIPVVTTLLRNGINVNSLDGNGRSALNMAMSRLKMLHASNSQQKNSVQIIEETTQILDLLRTYMLKSEGTCSELDSLSDLLASVSTKDKVFEVRNLLENFTSLKLSTYERSNI